MLLVEDEMLVADLFRSVLEDAGHRVTVVNNGLAALAADAVERADVLVTDLRMPHMGGSELVARLRERTPDLPVVVLSGYTGDAGVLGGGAPAGATILLSKPVSPRMFAREVAELVARAAADAARGRPAPACDP